MDSRNFCQTFMGLVLTSGLLACSTGYRAITAQIKDEASQQEMSVARCVAHIKDKSSVFAPPAMVPGFELEENTQALGGSLIGSKFDKTIYGRNYDNGTLVGLDRTAYIMEGDFTGSNYRHYIEFRYNKSIKADDLKDHLEIDVIKNGKMMSEIDIVYSVDFNHDCIDHIRYVTIANYDWDHATNEINVSVIDDIDANHPGSKRSKSVAVDQLLRSVAENIDMVRDPFKNMTAQINSEIPLISSGSVEKMKYEYGPDESIYNPVSGKTELMKTIISSWWPSEHSEPNVDKIFFAPSGDYMKQISTKDSSVSETVSADLWQASNFTNTSRSE